MKINNPTESEIAFTFSSTSSDTNFILLMSNSRIDPSDYPKGLPQARRAFDGGALVIRIPPKSDMIRDVPVLLPKSVGPVRAGLKLQYMVAICPPFYEKPKSRQFSGDMEFHQAGGGFSATLTLNEAKASP